jgi:uncharacterized repeat protein (TIGR03943 family)
MVNLLWILGAAMNRQARATVIFLVGLTGLRLVWTGAYSNFVQQHMRVPLVVASIAVFLLGIFEVISAFLQAARDDRAHARHVAPSVGILLVAPLLVLTAVAPTALGSAAANRVKSVVPTDKNDGFPPLPAGVNNVVTLKHSEFLNRALWDESGSLKDRQVRLTGIVVPDPLVADGFMLTRFMVGCCAADGLPMKIALRNVTETYSPDTWVEAVVVWIPPDTADGKYDIRESSVTVEVTAVSTRELANPPSSPYESPF